jgi:hypothetical protein
MRLTIVLLTALLCAAAAQASEVYRWTDKDGVVHYGDKPKTGAEALDVRPGSGTGEPSDPEAAKTQAARDAECQRRKTQLDTYKKASAIKETDNLGKTREYTAAEREQFLAQTEKQVAEACAPPPAAAAQ